MHAVERALDDLRIHLGGQRLAHPRRSGAEYRRAARLAGDDIVHQHVHLGGQDVDQVGLLRWQHQLVLQFRLVGVGRDVVHIHPDVVVQIEVEHQDEEMHRQLGEQPLPDAGLRILDLRFLLAREPRVALHAADELGENVAVRIHRQHTLAEDALVVHQPHRTAGRGQDDLVLARKIGIAVRRRQVLGEPADAAAGKLRTVLRPPVEIARRAFLITGDQRRRFLDVALGGENFGDRAAGDVRAGNTQRRRRQLGARVGLQFEKDLAALFFGRRRVVQPADHPGQRLAGDRRREHPAALGVFRQIAGHGRHRHFQLLRLEAVAAAGQRRAQGGNLRRLRPQLAVALTIQRLQHVQLGRLEAVERHLDAVAEAHLVAEFFQARKGLHHRLDVPAVNLQLHRLPPSG